MDKRYWNEFYTQRHADIMVPTTFARACLARIPEGSLVFELGCGNGRDAIFFARERRCVIACDQSEIAIRSLKELAADPSFAHAPRFVVADFTSLDEGIAGPIDTVYSRFTLHAVRKHEASSALRWAHGALRASGQLLVEARSVESSLYGKGELVEPDAFVYQGHYRRFIRREELIAELEELGFHLAEVIEAAGLAVHGDDDPVVIRVAATKER